MNADYLDFLKLIVLLNAKVRMVKDKYTGLNEDEIKVYELNSDISMIESLIDCISFKKHEIVEQMFDEYVMAYEQEFQEQAKVNNNE